MLKLCVMKKRGHAFLIGDDRGYFIAAEPCSFLPKLALIANLACGSREL